MAPTRFDVSDALSLSLRAIVEERERAPTPKAGNSGKRLAHNILSETVSASDYGGGALKSPAGAHPEIMTWDGVIHPTPETINPEARIPKLET
jgi:hypothetical protein